MWIFHLLLVLILLVIVYQDFSSRAISVWTIPFLLVLAIIISCQTINIKDLMINTLLNAGIFSFEFLLLAVYFSIKNHKPVQIINKEIGLGDIAFVAVMCVLFSPLVFNTILLVGLILTLIGYIILRLFAVNIKTIPLAGCLSCMLVILWTVKWTLPLDQLYNIQPIENLFLP